MNRLKVFFSGDRWLPSIPLTVFPLILVGRLLVQGKALFWGLPALQFNPWRLYAWETLRGGEIPLWNSLNGMGAPLMANYQLALWYPPSWPLYLFAALGGGPALAWGHTLLLAAHLIWAGFGMVRLLRALGAGKLGQMVAGLAFGLCGYLVARSNVFPMVWVAAWMPWVMLGASRISIPGRGMQERRGFMPPALVISLAMMLLAGHAQLAWYTLLLAGAWVIAGAWRGGWRGLLRSAARFGMAGLAAAGLAAVQLIPTAEFLLQSQRSAAVDYEMGMAYSFWPWRLLDFIAPNAFGSPGTGNYWGFAAYWEDAVYIGLLPLLLALSTLRFWRRQHNDEDPSTGAWRGLVRFLWVCVPVVLILALGWNTPVFPFLYRHVPTFDMFQAPTRFSILAVFALALLAGAGAEQWRKPTGRRLKRLKKAVAAAAAVAIGAGAGVVILQDVRPSLALAFSLAGLWAFLSGVLVLLMPPAEERARLARWTWAVAALIGIDLLAAGWSLVQGAPVSLYAETPPAVADIRQMAGGGRVYIDSRDEYQIKFARFFRFTNYRPLEDWKNLRSVLLPNMNLLNGIASANNFDPLVPGRWSQWMDHVDRLPEAERPPWLRLMNVSVVEERDIQIRAGVRFNPLEGAQPWYWASCSLVAGSAEESLEMVAARLRERGNMNGWVVLEYGSASVPECQTSPAIVRVVEQKSTYVMYEVNAEREGWLVLADSWYPGWRAVVDGSQTPVLIANQTFRAVVVPAGQHVVVLSYAPLSFTAGGVISLVTAICGLFLTRRWRDTRYS